MENSGHDWSARPAEAGLLPFLASPTGKWAVQGSMLSRIRSEVHETREKSIACMISIPSVFFPSTFLLFSQPQPISHYINMNDQSRLWGTLPHPNGDQTAHVDLKYKKLSTPSLSSRSNMFSGLGLFTFGPSGQSGNGFRIQGLGNTRYPHTPSSLSDDRPSYVGMREAFPLA